MSADFDKPTLDDMYMTAAELAARWRVAPESLANARSRGEGLPYTKVNGGSVRYRVADVIAAEQARTLGLTFERIERALATAPGVDAAAAARLAAHLRKELGG